MDVLFLSRLQFALTIMFHYLFPPLTIGLAGVIAVLMWKRWRTTDLAYEAAAKFWTKLFAVNFAVGVATGIVMEFQFGTNWATYSRFVGDVFGSALAAEGIFAFFLESGFLAVLVFGWGRVSKGLHFLASVLVAIGSAFSAIWIVVANSWQQTPAGFHVVGEGELARAEITDFWAMVFNPSSVVRLAHTMVGAYILGSFFVLSISAWYLLRGKHEEFAKRSIRAALPIAAIFSLLAAVTGDWHAKVVAKHQPAKLAAFEGHFTSQGPADLHIFGWPDEEARETRMSLSIPGGLSFLVHGDFKTPVPALDEFPRADQPPVKIPFAMFHLMVGLGVLFLALSWGGLLLLWRGRLFTNRGVLWAYVVTVLGAYAANQAGWIAAEVGRQPWTVYGLLRTADSVSKSVKGGEVLASILMFGFIYVLLFAVWVYVTNEKIQHGPEAVTPEREGGLVAAATALEAKEGASLTDAHSGRGA